MITQSKVIFAVADVPATIDFYRSVLGFTNHWLWGSPPTFGGASWGAVEVLFCLQPNLAGRTEGHQHWFHVEDVNALHERHCSAGAAIVGAIEDKPWGLREYVVRDPNGYHLRFAGRTEYRRPSTGSDALPGHVRIDRRIATLEEYRALNESVGWNTEQSNMAEALQRTTFGIVATDTRDNRAVGMLRVVGDGRYFTIWDVMVAADCQGQKIGATMMRRAMDHLATIAPKGAYVGLFTGKPKFYEQFGFRDSGGMSTNV